MLDDISEIIYNEEPEEQDEYAGIDYRTRQRIEHFEFIGRPYMADAIRMDKGLKPKHPLPERKKTCDIRVDNERRENYCDDLQFVHTPNCSISKSMVYLKKIRVDNDKFI